jgi:hypothetical protein
MTASKPAPFATRPTVDPWITELLDAPVYRFKLQIPQALLAQH